MYRLTSAMCCLILGTWLVIACAQAAALIVGAASK
jgi:uncharacterized protein (TIGR03067 family)